jgi:hypothetical protein
MSDYVPAAQPDPLTEQDVDACEIAIRSPREVQWDPSLDGASQARVCS